jgi:hypothetical protein
MRCQVPPLACPQQLVRQGELASLFRARVCLPGTYRFASGMTLLAAGSSAGPSAGRALRVIVALDGRAGGDGGGLIATTRLCERTAYSARTAADQSCRIQ